MDKYLLHEIVHMVMEAEKFQDLQLASQRPRRPGCVVPSALEGLRTGDGVCCNPRAGALAKLDFMQRKFLLSQPFFFFLLFSLQPIE